MRRGYAVGMRFRYKFGALDGAWVWLALFMTVLWSSAHGHRSTNLSILAASWIFLAALRVSNHLFVYWDLDSTGIRERRFWGIKQIPWSEVTLVQGLNGSPSSNFLEVWSSRPSPISASDRVLAYPGNREEFIAALRRFAPQANFEV